ncbi:putative UDP-glucuronosyltransferase 2C1 isoform X2 [Apostichopus japonicus]|uniref:Putative UDP-glucuronosyltransferase 2C1 isoform X2 n=1 Tax=Stichopus japonicus TaxID=307972 RepID=A0A2G8KU67_STIJA|nr:putative UDP-glucuronosyltransferase 2C1 isoform X2 [Apostichopus japonicus]
MACQLYPSHFIIVCFSIAFNLNGCTSSNILFFNGKGEGSHYFAAASLGEELVARGHSVTFLLADHYMHRAQHLIHANLFKFKSVQTYPSFNNEFQDFMESFFKVAFEGKNVLYETELLTIGVEMEVDYCKMVFRDEVLTSLREEMFDLVVFDPVWPCATGLSEYLGGRRVALLPTTLASSYLRAMNQPVNPATTAELGLGLPSKLNFFQRVQNVAVAGLYFVSFVYFDDMPYSHILSPYNISSASSSLQAVDFVITAGDPVIDKIVPMYPSHGIAAGLTTAPAKLLEEDLEEFMQSSGDHGVIVFTLGSYATHLPEALVKAFQDAFAKLPQKVIWQWKNKTPPSNLSANVKTMSWLPQNDLLGHDRTRLFIYHGGNNGLYEAIYHGVPVLVMPLIVDQFDTAQNVVEKEVGLNIFISDVTAENLGQALHELLTNEKYETNMKRLSAIFRERPQTPRERATSWIEHILKFGSAHLRTPGHDMNFIEYYLLDVIGFMLLCLSLVLVLIYLGIKYTLRIVCSVFNHKKSKLA